MPNKPEVGGSLENDEWEFQMITGDAMDITRRFMVVYIYGDITFAITCAYIGYQQIHVCCFTTSNCF